MAKKKSATTKAPAPKKPSKPAAGKTPTKSASKKSAPKQHDHDEVEIELDDAERDAVDHIVDCEQARDALEQEVNKVVTQAVRKICKVHGKSLSAAQAQNVAIMLFGD